ncbi:MAG: hypothetical protein AAGJ81_08205 [Verrucomicrobiota bacterium]
MSLTDDLTAPAKEEYFFEDGSSRRYWLLHEETGRYVSTNEPGMRRLLKGRGFDPHPDKGELLSPLDAKLAEIEFGNRVDMAIDLAGWKRGVHSISGHTVLVTKDPELIEPLKAADGWRLEWEKKVNRLFAFADRETLRKCVASILHHSDNDDYFGGCHGFPTVGMLLGNLLLHKNDPNDEESDPDCDQRDRFVSWWAHFLESIYEGKHSQGLAMALAGEADCGKSLLKLLVQSSVGNRVAKPYRYMIKAETHNADLFTAPLLSIDDENANTTYAARQAFGAEIKVMVADLDQRIRAMQKDGFTLRPTWRLMILLNDEPDRLKILPDVNDDIRDKLMILKGYRQPQPLPSKTRAEREAYWKLLVYELPYFIQWALDHEIAEKNKGRFGVRFWHHPSLMRGLNSLSQSAYLWELIERGIFESVSEWKGGAEKLKSVLANSEKLSRSEKDNLWAASVIGTILTKLSKQEEFQGRVYYEREGGTGSRNWILRKKASDKPFEQKEVEL